MNTETQMMHGFDFNGHDVSGWMMSEKLNGCRAYWDGNTMWTRGGRKIILPHGIEQALPKGVALDGEMYCPRSGFHACRVAVQYGPYHSFPADISFRAFDAPAAGGQFWQRYLFLQKLIQPWVTPVTYIIHHTCADISEAVDYMKAIQRDGGEGVVLRNPLGLYVPGRSRDVLKLKESP